MLECSESVDAPSRLVTEVVMHSKPELRLGQLLNELEGNGDFTTAIALFEGVFCRTRLSNYWILAKMAKIYFNEKRGEAAFFCASLANQIDPTGSAGATMNHILYQYFKSKDRAQEIANIFVSNLKLFPGATLAPAADLEPWLRKAGMFPQENAEATTESRYTHRVVEPSKCTSQVHTVYGQKPLPFAEIQKKRRDRSPIDVIEIHDAELFVQDGQCVAIDSSRMIQRDFSVGRTPDLVKYIGETLPISAVLDEAVVIQDYMAGHNYGHFLIDQMPRLALFEMAGVNVQNVTVFGPEITTGFQAQIVTALGVKNYVGTRSAARFKVRRLWISSDGKHPQLIAHYGETWGLNFVRKTLNLPPFTEERHQSSGQRRLYVSRNDGVGRHIANESELLPLLHDHGFERVTCEKLSFQEQVELFQNASHVMGPHGAGLANLVFAPQGLTFLEFFHPLFTPDNFAQLVPALNMNYAAFMAKDALSDAPEMNDQALAPPWDTSQPFPWRFRDIVVDKGELARYLQHNAQ